MNHVDVLDIAAKWLEYIKDSWLVKGSLAILSTVLVHLLGSWDIMLQAVLTLMALDFMAKIIKLSFDSKGFGRAIKAGKIRSKTLREKTMYKAFRSFITLAAGNQIANVLAFLTQAIGTGSKAITVYGIPISLATRAFFILYLCVGEVISILETLIGIDGDELKTLHDGINKSKQKFSDRILDLIINKIESRSKDK